MYSQVDEEGHQHILLDNTIDSRSGEKAIAKEDKGKQSIKRYVVPVFIAAHGFHILSTQSNTMLLAALHIAFLLDTRSLGSQIHATFVLLFCPSPCK
jgi:hypothetical protein